MNNSKATEVIMLCKGANRILNNLDEAFKYQLKKYNAECGSGFYTIRDEDLAEKYARAFTSTGQIPIVNYYKFELQRMKRDCIRQAYFNDLSFNSLDYVGRNLSGIFPSSCKYNRDPNISPKDKCYECDNELCEWSSPYIEAFLSENVDFCFDDILKSFIVKDISEEEAVSKINKILIEHKSPLRIQIVIRSDLKDYIHYSHYRALAPKEAE